MLDITCCVSCGWGKKGNKEEIEQQLKKYDEYICVKCENLWNKIVEMGHSSGELILDKGFIKTKALITSKHIYYHDGARVRDPKTPFLGFGGSWLLVIDKRKPEVYVTNNLYHDRTVPDDFQSKLKESGAINADVIWLDKNMLEELKGNLNKIPYLNREE